jgi:hypothetical protein
VRHTSCNEPPGVASSAWLPIKNFRLKRQEQLTGAIQHPRAGAFSVAKLADSQSPALAAGSVISVS